MSLLTAAARGSGAFSPGDVAGLLFWGIGDNLTGANAAAVASWADASGSGNDANQGTGAKQPTKRTNVLNGHAVCRFDGGDCLVTPTLAFGSALGISVYAVASAAAGTDQAIVETSANTGGNSGAWILYHSAANKLQLYAHAPVDNERLSTATFSGTGTFKLLSGFVNLTMNRHQNHVYVSGDPGMSYAAQPPKNTVAIGDYAANVGARGNAASLGLTGDIAELLVYAGNHTARVRKQIEAYLAAKYSLTVRAVTANLVFEGDSLTEGDGSTLHYTTNWPQQLVNRFTDGVHSWNPAVSGQTAQTMYANRAKIAALFAAGMPNVCVLWAGTNDMAAGVGDKTGEVAIAQVYQYADYLRGIGYLVVLLDCLDRFDAAAGPGWSARRTAFNDEFAASATDHCDAAIQVSLVEELRFPDDPTYFDADQVHINSTGQGIVADTVEPVLGALGVT